MESALSIGSFVVSIVALVISVFADRRTKRLELRELQTGVLDKALGFQLSLNSLYSNVLTLNPDTYRPEVKEVIMMIKSEFPERIHSARRLRETAQDLRSVEALTHIAKQLAVLQAEAQGVAEAVTHGLERGKVT